jgi:hypothetical protein
MRTSDAKAWLVSKELDYTSKLVVSQNRFKTRFFSARCRYYEGNLAA